jgi:hypothetical protein
MTNLSNQGEARTRCHCGAPTVSASLAASQGRSLQRSLRRHSTPKPLRMPARLKLRPKLRQRKPSVMLPQRPRLLPPLHLKLHGPSRTKATEAGSSVSVPAADSVVSTPSKRPRGRPRKHPLPDPGQPVVKRPRGRPPSTPVSEGQIVVKRGRGRPRKHPLPDPNQPVVKRPVGRPRKHPLPVPVDAGPSSAAIAAKAEPAAVRVRGWSQARWPPAEERDPTIAIPSQACSGRLEAAMTTITSFFKRGPGRPQNADRRGAYAAR